MSWQQWRLVNTLFPQAAIVSLIILLFTFSPSGHSQTAQDPKFTLAMQYVGAGNWQKAEDLFKAILADNPQQHRSRLELGLVYAKLNKHQQARNEFQTLLAHPAVPDKVKDNIRRLLQQLPDSSSHSPANIDVTSPNNEQSSSPHQFSGNLQLSIGYDDNVRYSAADYFMEDDPFLNGVFLDVDEDSPVFVAPDGFVYNEDGNQLFANDGFFDLGNPDRENRITEARIDLEHQYRFDFTTHLTWHNQLSMQTTDNAQLSNYDRLQLRFESSLAWRFSPYWKLEVAAHHRLLERNSQVQVRAFGLTPELTYYSELGSWTVGMQWMRREYEDSLFVTGEVESVYAGFDNKISSLSGKWSDLFWNQSLLLLAKIELSDSNASDDFDYKGRRFTLASVYKFNDQWNLLLSADDFHQDYSESVGGPLDDDISTFRSKLTWQISDDLAVFVAGERAIRTSDIYGGLKSDKTVTQLGIEYQF